MYLILDTFRPALGASGGTTEAGVSLVNSRSPRRKTAASLNRSGAFRGVGETVKLNREGVQERKEEVEVQESLPELLISDVIYLARIKGYNVRYVDLFPVSLNKSLRRAPDPPAQVLRLFTAILRRLRLPKGIFTRLAGTMTLDPLITPDLVCPTSVQASLGTCIFILMYKTMSSKMQWAFLYRISSHLSFQLTSLGTLKMRRECV